MLLEVSPEPEHGGCSRVFPLWVIITVNFIRLLSWWERTHPHLLGKPSSSQLGEVLLQTRELPNGTGKAYHRIPETWWDCFKASITLLLHSGDRKMYEWPFEPILTGGSSSSLNSSVGLHHPVESGCKVQLRESWIRGFWTATWTSVQVSSPNKASICKTLSKLCNHSDHVRYYQ